MKNLHKHFNSISENDLDPNKTFTPIRRLILLDDKKWELFLEDNSLEKLGAIENLFAINEIFPMGVPIFIRELGKFLAELDTLQVTLSFLDSLSKYDRISNIIEDFRISIQNFIFFISIKSYYSSFQELRKMLEGILWINHLVTSEEDLPNKVTLDKYSELLNKINPKYSRLYKKLNKLFHYSAKETPYFNINRVYRPKDWLMELLQDTTDIADDFIKDSNSFFKKIDHVQIQRYSLLVDILGKARETYHLKNWNITATENAVLPFENQKLFSELLLEEDKNINNISFMSKQYEVGLHELLQLRDFNSGKIPPNGSTYLYFSKFDPLFLEYQQTLSSITINTSHLLEQELKNIRISKNLRINRKILQKSIQVTRELFVYEIYEGGHFGATFLKSVLEDVILNNSINKGINFMLLFLIEDFLKETHDIEVPYLKQFVKYKHLIINERQMYGGSQNRNTGEKNLFPEYKKALKELLDVIAETYRR